MYFSLAFGQSRGGVPSLGNHLQQGQPRALDGLCLLLKASCEVSGHLTGTSLAARDLVEEMREMTASHVGLHDDLNFSSPNNLPVRFKAAGSPEALQAPGPVPGWRESLTVVQPSFASGIAGLEPVIWSVVAASAANKFTPGEARIVSEVDKQRPVAIDVVQRRTVTVLDAQNLVLALECVEDLLHRGRVGYTEAEAVNVDVLCRPRFLESWISMFSDVHELVVHATVVLGRRLCHLGMATLEVRLHQDPHVCHEDLIEGKCDEGNAAGHKKFRIARNGLALGLILEILQLWKKARIILPKAKLILTHCNKPHFLQGFRSHFFVDGLVDLPNALCTCFPQPIIVIRVLLEVPQSRHRSTVWLQKCECAFSFLFALRHQLGVVSQQAAKHLEAPISWKCRRCLLDGGKAPREELVHKRHRHAMRSGQQLLDLAPLPKLDGPEHRGEVATIHKLCHRHTAGGETRDLLAELLLVVLQNSSVDLRQHFTLKCRASSIGLLDQEAHFLCITQVLRLAQWGPDLGASNACAEQQHNNLCVVCVQCHLQCAETLRVDNAGIGIMVQQNLHDSRMPKVCSIRDESVLRIWTESHLIH
mmetsp:Transcript_28358/g.65729  ORF Transcript_28358/g.65729 Transcript_28358/m.65729 type:complete len:590 (+) Transcript_28358:186-1955(+)